MMLATKATQRREGATAVELAAVVVVFTMLFFGILEYCLIVFTMNVVENAAREGARYAVVNVSDTTLVSDTQTYVQSLMGGLDTKMTGYSCQLYKADTSGNNTGSATGAQFGQYICCDVSITYTPITPGLLYLKAFTIRSKCSMISEAN
ncbi:MAG: pilus assembly protein [Planctomycetes bacterium]|nr:pilus assembly protein [Planctomycetota bacterium]